MTRESGSGATGLLHDLSNIFQTLVEPADLLSDDPRWQPISAAILRNGERGAVWP